MVPAARSAPSRRMPEAAIAGVADATVPVAASAGRPQTVRAYGSSIS
jgi:hypothetical protein